MHSRQRSIRRRRLGDRTATAMRYVWPIAHSQAAGAGTEALVIADFKQVAARQKKPRAVRGRRGAGSALGLGAKTSTLNTLNSTSASVFPAKLDRRKKSPAQGGPARGDSAPGLGGKNERAEPQKHRGCGIVPQSGVKLRQFWFTLLMGPLAPFRFAPSAVTPRPADFEAGSASVAGRSLADP